MTPADLLAARTALGLTQRGLAERLDVPQATVWRWETAQTAIQHPTILGLALRALVLERLAVKPGRSARG